MKLTRFYTVTFICFCAAYLIALLTIPADASVLKKYDLSPFQARALGLSIALPLIAVWSLALGGLRRITRYALKIQKQNEGPGFMLISQGLGVLVLGQPLSSFVSTSLNYVARENPSLTAASQIIINYLSLLVISVGFYIIARGTHQLLLKSDKKSESSPIFWRVFLIIFSVIFVYVTFTNPARTVVVPGVQKAVYYLPDWLIATTIVIPYIVTWYLGLIAVYQLYAYSRLTKGILYKQALRLISHGLGFIIVGSILIRFVSRLNFFFNDAELKILLTVIYLIVVSISVGYIYIAVGAKKLKRIEDV